jgi:trehalose synthase
MQVRFSFRMTGACNLGKEETVLQGQRWPSLRGDLANVESYRLLISDELFDEIVALARELRGVRICHINSTAFGGGVASFDPLPPSAASAGGICGLAADRMADPSFYGHQSLQRPAGDRDLPEAEQSCLEVNEQSAALLDDDYDVFVVHDPQPAAIRHFTGARGAKWIWRCHIDTSAPNERVSRFLRPFIAEYDAVIFTMAEFLLPELQAKRMAFIAPAIDPLATKNMDLPRDLCRQAMADAGIDLSRPVLVQVSRFDPWKDPLGVIQAYGLVKAGMPGVQLALIGAMAGDDPEVGCWTGSRRSRRTIPTCMCSPTSVAWAAWRLCFSARLRCGDPEIAARGFWACVVAEALWKEKPVVAGRAGAFYAVSAGV